MDHKFAPRVNKPWILPTMELKEHEMESIKAKPLPTLTEQLSSPPIARQKRLLISVIELPATQRVVDSLSSDSNKDEDDSGT